MGTLAGAAPDRDFYAPLPPLRPRWLWRRQAQRVRGSHYLGADARRSAVAAQGNCLSALKIALIRQKYNAAGGAERFVAQAMRELAKQGATVTLITRQWKDNSGQPIVELAPVYWGSTWRDWSFARAVCQHLRRTKYDLVQSHERLACCDVFRAGDGVHREWLAQRARGFNAVRRATMYFNPHHGYLLQAERRMFESPRLRAVICNSRMVRDEILRHYEIDEAKLSVIYNGVDLEAFQPDLRSSWRDT